MRTSLLWVLWTAMTVAGVWWIGTAVFIGGDRTMLLPDETTSVHHQFETACESCHDADPLVETKDMAKAMNKACLSCHKDELETSNDSHPYKKFRDPRMADFWEKIDARQCMSCHVEHNPEITVAEGVTLPMDFCVACHSEGKQDVRVNRPSHEGLGFETCASAGCHNFHDNTALYEDFLVKHAGGEWLKEAAVLAAAVPFRLGEADIAKQVGDYLEAAQADAPEAVLAEFEPAEMAAWAASAHAEAGVNCAYCHAPKGAKKGDVEKIAGTWVDHPETKACGKCHRAEQVTWSEGRHGMASHKGIAKPRKVAKQFKTWGMKGLEDSLPKGLLAYLEDASPEPLMSTARARVPLKDSAHGQALTCANCHDPHAVDLRPARVEACTSCHNDAHTEAYFDSAHYALFEAEMAGDGPPGSGVGCADCHMPKITDEQTGRVFTSHNQNAYLRPNEKMIRPVCMSCHSLEFSIDALADPALTANNFQGRPVRHIESIDWALRRVTTEGSVE